MTTPTSMTLEEAVAAGDGTLHGAIDYWQERAINAERDLAAAQEHVKRAEYEVKQLSEYRNEFARRNAELYERAQRAEALAESYRQDAERYRWLRNPQEHICVSVEKRDWDIDEMFWTNEFESLVRAELDAAIDAARRGNDATGTVAPINGIKRMD